MVRMPVVRSLSRVEMTVGEMRPGMDSEER